MKPIQKVFDAVTSGIPGARVEINGYSSDEHHYDPKGREGNHLTVEVWSSDFGGLSLLEQHRMVHDAVSELMQMNGGFIHALVIKTHTK